MFNYVITIHNKEDILEQTLAGVAACCKKESRIFPVLDGCTDRSERIVDAFIASSRLYVRKINTADVHELRTINAALSQITEGFTIVLQDDVVLQEPDLERKILALYEAEGPKLGIISFRLAANIRPASLLDQLGMNSFVPQIQECDLVVNADDFITGLPKVHAGEFRRRMVAIKGPNCIPGTVLNKVGILDDNLAPYGYDDHEYCVRALRAGFINGLFPVAFVSKNEWGGSRRDLSFSKQSRAIFLRNRKYILEKHGTFISEYWKSGQVARGEPIGPSELFRLLRERGCARIMPILKKARQG